MRYIEANEDIFNYPEQYVLAHCIGIGLLSGYIALISVLKG